LKRLSLSLEGRKSLIPIERDDHQRTGINYPAAASGSESLPPGHEPFRGGAWLGEPPGSVALFLTG